MEKIQRRMRPARVRTASMGTCFSQNKRENEMKRIVRVKQGLIEGEKLTTRQGMTCDYFLGLPYAKPPVGELRFKKPEPPEPWTGLRKCNKYPNRSMFKEMPWDKVLHSAPLSEDCLYLNVFTPSFKENKKYPVMFYVHGGGWLMDSADKYTPKNICRLLVSQEIIVVTIHYRLGYLGFFSTGDEACTGNFGLYDMLAALKWTHENIGAFGGDQNDITIAGQSAGGVSVDILSISPLAQGLFSKKIVMGGNSFCHWATTGKDEIRDYCKKKARKLGWKPRDGYSSTLEESQDLVAFFKSLPAHKLATTMMFSKVIFRECRLPLAPVIGDEILPDQLDVLRAAAPTIPTIVGGGEYEALLFMAIGFLRGSDKEINSALDEISKRTKLTRMQVNTVVQKIYGDSPVLRANSKLRKMLYVEMISDIFANYGVFSYMKYSRHHPEQCYAYSFDHQSNNLWGWLGHLIPFKGGTHTSEVNYLFDCNYLNAALPMDKRDKAISTMTAKYFTNFVKTGNPNGDDLPNWMPVTKEMDEELRVLCFKFEPDMKVKAYNERLQKYEDHMSLFYEEKSTAKPSPRDYNTPVMLNSVTVVPEASAPEWLTD